MCELTWVLVTVNVFYRCCSESWAVVNDNEIGFRKLKFTVPIHSVRMPLSKAVDPISHSILKGVQLFCVYVVYIYYR
jgi:hypothetical protein